MKYTFRDWLFQYRDAKKFTQQFSITQYSTRLGEARPFDAEGMRILRISAGTPFLQRGSIGRRHSNNLIGNSVAVETQKVFFILKAVGRRASRPMCLVTTRENICIE
jgi:hypothetical protein